MDPRPPFPLRVALRTGETRCPMRQGIIAIGACVSLQQERPGRCLELGCHHLGHRTEFENELKRSRGEEAPRDKIPKIPGKRPWRVIAS
jgi:hypothetical protein